MFIKFRSELVPARIRIQFLFLLLLVFSSFMSFAQSGQPYNLAKVIPPSPTAAALGAYGNIEMSYYSGIPNISIPLYDINTPNHALSISMSYNASGTKVSENAGWVGLGWSLNAGGVITKTVRGIDDFGQNGYYSSMAIPPYTNPPLAENQPYFREMSLNRNDGDADIINYNIGPYSGKFVMGKRADGSKIYMDERNNLKVEYTPGKWTITDSKGYKYHLGKQERAIDYTYYSSSGVELPDDAPLSAYKKSFEPDVITAWYLDSISSPNKETIKFFYKTDRRSLSLVSKSEEKHNLIKTLVNCGTNLPSIPNFLDIRSASRQEIFNVSLDKIIFKGGTVEFTVSDRDDIEYTGTQKAAKLSEIVVKNNAGVQIKKYKFKYTYFFSASTAGRLKLDEIQEFGVGDIANAPYKFTYFEPNSIPLKYSKSVDHWNYFNGKINQSILPSVTLESQFFSGGDRQPDSVWVYPKKGVLSSITYPTGGSTSFDFELNDYSNMKGSDAFIYTPMGVQANARPTDEFANRSKTFTIKQGDTVNVKISYGYTKHDPNANSMKYIQRVFVYLIGANNAQIASWSNWPCPGNTEDPTCGMDDGAVKTQDVVLTGGTYRLEVTYLQGYSTTADARWNAKTPVTRLKGAGLRVKSITNSENGKTTLIRKFDYTSDGKTTGKLISQPLYSYLYETGGNSSNDNCKIINTYMGRISGSIYLPGLLSRGTLVGYSKVTETLGANGEGGRTEYFYSNSEDMANSKPFFPSVSSPYNGKLATKLTYNSAGKLIRKFGHEYSIKETEYLKGVRILNPPLNQDPTQNTFYMEYYDNVSYWVVNSSENQTEYVNGLPALTTTTNYFYNNPIHKEVTVKEVTTSQSGKSRTEYFYPHDVNTSGNSSSVVSKLIMDWRVSTLLQQNEVRGGKTQTMKTIYTTTSDGLTLPSEIRANSGKDAAEEIRIQNHKYDASGNLLTNSLFKGPLVSYKWGYTNLYPIAEIKNASTAEFYRENFEEGSSFDSNLQLDYNKPHTGKASGRLTNNSSTEVFSHGTSPTSINITKPTKFTYSGWIFSNGPGAGIVFFMKRAGETGYFSFVEEINPSKTNEWVYVTKEFEVPADVKTLFLRLDNNGPGNVWFDDLRIQPSEASMNTYTYDPLIGVTSIIEDNGKTTYYNYDGFNRLANIRNQNQDILTNYQYNYGSAPAPITTYTNDERTASFTRNNCELGQIGSSFLYVVPSGKYSANTKAEANAMADAEITSQGQIVANGRGSCSLQPGLTMIIKNAFSREINFIITIDGYSPTGPRSVGANSTNILNTGSGPVNPSTLTMKVYPEGYFPSFATAKGLWGTKQGTIDLTTRTITFTGLNLTQTQSFEILLN